MENSVAIPELTEEQKKAIFLEMQEKEKQQEAVRKREVESYSQLKHETVSSIFRKLQDISTMLENSKEEIYNEFHALLKIKSELYGIKETQFSHTWTTLDGKISVKTGSNDIDRWDETVSAGLEMINVWLEKKGGEFAELVRELLKPNKDGQLKANRVLELENHADRKGDEELIKAVKVIREAHRPDKTSTYVRCTYKDEDNNNCNLPLSMSSIK